MTFEPETQNPEPKTPIVLCIGGLDPSGGAGLPADARAVAAFGAHPCAVCTAVIAQNTQGVARVETVLGEMLRAQLDHLLDDIAPYAVKIGMLPHIGAVEIVAQTIRVLNVPTVLDPVFAPSTGRDFSDDETVFAIARELFPLCELVTPNTLEAARLCRFQIEDVGDMKRAASHIIEQLGAQRVLVKGGHLPQSEDIIDVLYDGESCVELRAPRIAGVEVRGTGCLLAASIAAQRAHHVEIEVAVKRAKSWLTQQIKHAKPIGQGRRVAI